MTTKKTKTTADSTVTQLVKQWHDAHAAYSRAAWDAVVEQAGLEQLLKALQKFADCTAALVPIVREASFESAVVVAKFEQHLHTLHLSGQLVQGDLLDLDRDAIDDVALILKLVAPTVKTVREQQLELVHDKNHFVHDVLKRMVENPSTKEWNRSAFKNDGSVNVRWVNAGDSGYRAQTDMLKAACKVNLIRRVKNGVFGPTTDGPEVLAEVEKTAAAGDNEGTRRRPDGAPEQPGAPLRGVSAPRPRMARDGQRQGGAR